MNRTSSLAALAGALLLLSLAIRPGTAWTQEQDGAEPAQPDDGDDEKGAPGDAGSGQEGEAGPEGGTEPATSDDAAEPATTDAAGAGDAAPEAGPAADSSAAGGGGVTPDGGSDDAGTADEQAGEALAAPAGREPFGLSLGLEIQTAYGFRGLNLFQQEQQSDQNHVFSPSLSFTIPGTGLGIGYWGAFQWSGSNITELVRSGVGHEQDILVWYDLELAGGTLALTPSLVWYFYPFAVEEDAGTKLPSWLEPSVEATISPGVDVSLLVSYMAGLQPVLRPYSYLYVRPKLSRSFEFGDVIAMELAVGAGFKVFTHAPGTTDNVFDVQLDWALPLQVHSRICLTPALHAAWTSLDGLSFREELFAWWSLGASFDL